MMGNIGMKIIQSRQNIETIIKEELGPQGQASLRIDSKQLANVLSRC